MSVNYVVLKCGTLTQHQSLEGSEKKENLIVFLKCAWVFYGERLILLGSCL